MINGIKTTPNGVFCNNCGKFISHSFTFDDQFCSECGNPLTIEAYDIVKDKEYRLQTNLLKVIKEAHFKGANINSVIKDLYDNLNQM